VALMVAAADECEWTVPVPEINSMAASDVLNKAANCFLEFTDKFLCQLHTLGEKSSGFTYDGSQAAHVVVC